MPGKKIILVCLALLPTLLRAQDSTTRPAAQPAAGPHAAAQSAAPHTAAQSATPHTAAQSAASNSQAWDLIGLTRAAHFASFRHPIKVAIIDDGFDIDNPLWAAYIAHNKGDIPGNNIDDDHNGKIDDYEGWDFGDNDEDVRPARSVLDKESHGTRVLGVFWQVLQQLSAGAPTGLSILPIKAVSDGHLNNYLKEGYRGIEYAIEQKADVILCSWSGPNISPEEKAILARAQAKGIVIVAAAGNFYALQPMYPGAFPSVINVAATDNSGHKLRFSNYGTFVDLSAPGNSLITYNPYQGGAPNARLSATSAATPIVAAVVTAIRAARPDIQPAAIERLLKNTAIPLDSANGLYAGNLGAGLLNVAAIRDAIQGNSNPGTAGDGTAGDGTVGSATVRGATTAQGFIDLRHLSATNPIRIAPAGHYPGIKFILQQETNTPRNTPVNSPINTPIHTSHSSPRNTPHNTPRSAPLPDIRMTLFREGQPVDTLIRRDKLPYPLVEVADSIYLYSAAAGLTSTLTHHTGKTAAPVTLGAPSRSNQPGRWWSWSVMTMDSSTLYCGGTVDISAGAEGNIEDGSADHVYTGRNDCKWQLTAPPGKRIKIDFDQFDTEPKVDQVYIFNGNSTKDPILAIFSGHKIPPPITSWGNSVLVWFITNEDNNYQGWRLHYRLVDGAPDPKP